MIGVESFQTEDTIFIGYYFRCGCHMTENSNYISIAIHSTALWCVWKWAELKNYKVETIKSLLFGLEPCSFIIITVIEQMNFCVWKWAELKNYKVETIKSLLFGLELCSVHYYHSYRANGFMTPSGTLYIK